MEIFDSLPPEVREILNDAPVPVSPADAKYVYEVFGLERLKIEIDIVAAKVREKEEQDWGL